MVATAPTSTCPGCGSPDVYKTVKPISSGGGYSPDLLPGLHPWYGSAKLHGLLCARCGLYRQVADEAALQRLRESPKWRRS